MCKLVQAGIQYDESFNLLQITERIKLDQNFCYYAVESLTLNVVRLFVLRLIAISNENASIYSNIC